MQSSLVLLSLSVLALGSFVSSRSPSQAPPQPPPKERSGQDEKRQLDEIPLRQSRQVTLEAMQGMWRLTGFEARTEEPERRRQVGYCLVSGHHLAIEVHLWRERQKPLEPENRDFFSGIHRFELDSTSTMETSTVIASFINRTARVDHEAPGKTRRFVVETSANRMRLTRDDGQTMDFERVADEGTEDKDVFGRPIRKPAPTEEEDD